MKTRDIPAAISVAIVWGLALIAIKIGVGETTPLTPSAPRFDGASLVPLLMVVAAALFWGAGNIAAKFAGRVDVLALATWSSLAPPAPLFLLSMLTEGRGGLASFAHPSLRRRSRCSRRSSAGSLAGASLASRSAHLSYGAPFW
jgi:drug/metabolite transporter (DMT)-like permease